jgi:hypothetical protein
MYCEIYYCIQYKYLLHVHIGATCSASVSMELGWEAGYADCSPHSFCHIME